MFLVWEILATFRMRSSWLREHEAHGDIDAILGAGGKPHVPRLLAALSFLCKALEPLHASSDRSHDTSPF